AKIRIIAMLGKRNQKNTDKISKYKRKIKIKKGDTVIVIAGKDKGKKGQVQKINYKNNKCLVEDVNTVTKHQRPTQDSPQGNIVRTNSPIHISNVMYYSNKLGKGIRLGYKITEDGKKIRIGRHKGQEIQL
ncbi:MAG: 50S ribosomal protein L24, partial [Spirochaetota bacterium]